MECVCEGCEYAYTCICMLKSEEKIHRLHVFIGGRSTDSMLLHNLCYLRNSPHLKQSSLPGSSEDITGIARES